MFFVLDSAKKFVAEKKREGSKLRSIAAGFLYSYVFKIVRRIYAKELVVAWLSSECFQLAMVTVEGIICGSCLSPHQ